MDVPFLVCNFRIKAYMFSPLKLMLVVRFFVDILYQVKEVPFYSWFTENFQHEWILNF